MVPSARRQPPARLDFLSPNHYLAVTHEVSKTTTLYRLSVPEPAALVMFGFGLAGLGLARRRNGAAA
jgi:hypothetical protein